jgi:hypothetical protein
MELAQAIIHSLVAFGRNCKLKIKEANVTLCRDAAALTVGFGGVMPQPHRAWRLKWVPGFAVHRNC